ncbi:MAG: 2-oxoacid:acceptor oxidoreductase family protein [Thermodesulfobacteriota bacterium]|nr:2-oxoacid:acceptor oxidoreductase family protein [Thermodesulfobacteriota bacterium]
MNQETVEKHKDDLKSGGAILYDPDKVEAKGIGIPFTSIVKEIKGISIMRNTAAIGAMAKSLDIEWSVVDELISHTIEKRRCHLIIVFFLPSAFLQCTISKL